MLVLEILFILFMIFWFLSLLPIPMPVPNAQPWLAFLAVLMLGLTLYMGAFR